MTISHIRSVKRLTIIMISFVFLIISFIYLVLLSFSIFLLFYSISFPLSPKIQHRLAQEDLYNMVRSSRIDRLPQGLFHYSQVVEAVRCFMCYFMQLRVRSKCNEFLFFFIIMGCFMSQC